jgi:guanine deaminase
LTNGLLIKAATILDPETPLRVGDLRIAHGRIVEIGRRLRREDEEEIDASRMLAMPGLVNAHTHSGQSLDRGTANNMPLDLWMVWSVYGGPELTPEDAYTTAACGALEMLASGCTSVLDQVYLPLEEFDAHAEAVLTAYADVGMRAVVAPMVQDRDFLESLELEHDAGARPLAPLSQTYEPRRVLDHLERFVASAAGRTATLTAALGPTAPQRCSDELLGLILELARRTGVGVHTHLLETKTQRLAAERRYGRPIVEHLAALGYLSGDVSYAHGVWLTPDEFVQVGCAGATIVHNPVSNLRLGSGVMPLQYLIRRGIAVALGSDGAASNDSQNLFEVLKVASILHTLYGARRSWLQPEDVWRACLLGGAGALRAPVGRIAPDAAADIVLLRLDRHALGSRQRLVASLINAEHGESVDTVVVGGRVVLREGASTGVDEVAVRQAGRAFMDRTAACLPRRARIYAAYEQAIGRSIDRVEIDTLEPVKWWPTPGGC